MDEEMGAIMDTYYEKMMAIIKETFREATEACRAVTPACLEEEKESAPEETEAVAEPQEVPEGATEEETIGAAKYRSRDLRLRVPWAVEDADQRRWSVEARVCRHRRRADTSYRSCNAQGRTS
jgi:hypothetical protein